MYEEWLHLHILAIISQGIYYTWSIIVVSQRETSLGRLCQSMPKCNYSYLEEFIHKPEIIAREFQDRTLPLACVYILQKVTPLRYTNGFLCSKILYLKETILKEQNFFAEGLFVHLATKWSMISIFLWGMLSVGNEIEWDCHLTLRYIVNWQ